MKRLALALLLAAYVWHARAQLHVPKANATPGAPIVGLLHTRHAQEWYE